MCLKTLFSCFRRKEKCKGKGKARNYNTNLNAGGDHNIPVPPHLTTPDQVIAYYTHDRLLHLPQGQLLEIAENQAMPLSVRHRADAMIAFQQRETLTTHTQPWVNRQRRPRSFSSVPSDCFSPVTRNSSARAPSMPVAPPRATRSEPVEDPAAIAYRAYRRRHDEWCKYSAA